MAAETASAVLQLATCELSWSSSSLLPAVVVVETQTSLHVRPRPLTSCRAAPRPTKIRCVRSLHHRGRSPSVQTNAHVTAVAGFVTTAPAASWRQPVRAPATTRAKPATSSSIATARATPPDSGAAPPRRAMLPQANVAAAARLEAAAAATKLRPTTAAAAAARSRSCERLRAPGSHRVLRGVTDGSCRRGRP